MYGAGEGCGELAVRDGLRRHEVERTRETSFEKEVEGPDLVVKSRLLRATADLDAKRPPSPARKRGSCFLRAPP
jgi:hypothetical protein